MLDARRRAVGGNVDVLVQMLVARMMEFTGNTDEHEVKALTDRLSQGCLSFREAPPVVHLRDSATDDEMREVWWHAALQVLPI